MTALLSFIFVAAFTVAALLLFLPGPRRTLYGQMTSGQAPAGEMNLPGPIARTVGNLTQWKASGRFGGSATSVARLLQESDNPWGISVGQFRAIVLLSVMTGAGIGAVVAGLFAALPAALLGWPVAVVAVVAAAVGATVGALIGWTMPSSVLKGRARKRGSAVAGDLDFALDLFAMAVQSGYPIQRAVASTYEFLPDGPLRNELHRVMQDVESGSSFADAVRSMAGRVPGTKMADFARVLIDCNADGRDRTEMLRRNARELRDEVAQSADENAGKAEAKAAGLLGVTVLLLVPIPLLVPMVPLILENVSQL